MVYTVAVVCNEGDVAGGCTGVQVKKIGDIEYLYPRPQVSTVYLWPVEEPELATSMVFIDGGLVRWPWGWWGGPGWGWFNL
ncbi:MAG: Slp family lipoprotein [Acidithiobacillus sp.]